MTDTDFKQVGREAYRNGEPASPVLNETIREAISGLTVGGGAAAIMRDFSQGWHEANAARTHSEGARIAQETVERVNRSTSASLALERYS